MGPPSGNGGYGSTGQSDSRLSLRLQWVHRLVTVVMDRYSKPAREVSGLQWVHRLVTVVMPALDYYHQTAGLLQWVHRLVTVVMGGRHHPADGGRGASMGPPSGNGGYAGCLVQPRLPDLGFNGSTVW